MAEPMPDIEVGDWIEDYIHIRLVQDQQKADWWNSRKAGSIRAGITEIRKANGQVWRRDDPGR